MTTRICAMLLVVLMGCDEKKVVVPKSDGNGKSVEMAQTYTIAAAETPLKVNEKGTAKIVVTSKSNYKINPNYPWKFTSDDPRVLTPEVTGQIDSDDGTKTGTIEFEGKEARIPIEVKPDTPGTFELSGNASFSTCEPGENGRCFFAREEPVTVKVVVQ